jgi:glycosyltransferase involved in cell wall biosynthesis
MRLAFFSPLNPVPSGISDYSEELLPLLARAFEIELIVDNYTPSNPALSQLRTLTLDEFKKRAREFDLVLYHMGNSPAHANIYKTLCEIPGVVVMHDVVLHHLRAWQTLDRGDAAGYIKAMREDYGEAGAELARLEASGLASLDRFDYPLNGSVVRAARALVVHSEYAARQVQPIAPDTPVAVIPMGIAPMPEISTAEARARLNLPAGAFIVAAFGEIHPYKRVTIALESFAEFHARFPDSLFLLIGHESPNDQVEGVIHALRLSEAVRRIGFAPSADYVNYIAAADVCLNLRYPTAGETSASLLRMFAAGKAVIVTRTGAYAELPEGVCAKIEADEYEQDLLRTHLEFLARRADIRAALGANARAFAARSHLVERAAEAYVDFLGAVYDGRAESKSYLREGEGDRETGKETRGERETGGQGDAETHKQGVAGRGREEDWETGKQNAGSGPEAASGTFRPQPRTPDSPDIQPSPDTFRDSVARYYFELGLDVDDPSLGALALAIVELGLNQGERDP